jgi:nitrite reductase/ring-hydroxylating ferredoxin subunit
MERKKYTWYKVANSINEINFSSNDLAEVEAGGKTICVALYNDNLLACTKKCPHAGGILANGFVDGMGNIICPLHRYKFSLHNGRNVSGEGYFLKTFQVEIRNEGIFIGFEENKLFNW